MIAVIGDVHGCFFTLKSLTEQIRSKYNSIEIYCVGDLVDRGNFSFEVMEFVSEQNITFTPGNHDFMFYYHLKEPSNPIGKPWIHNGCEPTLKSYQGRWEKINDH
jgi:serine/threonine protein phosphatase 1